MTFLLTLWTISLLVMGVLFVMAHLRFIAFGRRAEGLPGGVREFLHTELLLGRRFADEMGRHLIRHTKIIGAKAKGPIARGQTIITERIFGKQEVIRGGATSFFLKHIAEFKEKNKREGPGREIE